MTSGRQLVRRDSRCYGQRGNHGASQLIDPTLGMSGALTWFAPVQPFLKVIALGLMAWALRTRLTGEIACEISVTESVQVHDSVIGQDATS